MGGKGGGGRRDMAQAGGPEAAEAEAALAAVESAVAAKVPIRPSTGGTGRRLSRRFAGQAISAKPA